MNKFCSSAVAVAGASLVVAGCTSSGTPTLSVDDFTAGSCRQVAPLVLDIGRLADTAGRTGDGPARVEAALTTHQATLRALRKPPSSVPELVVAIGFFRIGVDSHTYHAQLLTDLRNAQRGVQRECTAGARS